MMGRAQLELWEVPARRDVAEVAAEVRAVHLWRFDSREALRRILADGEWHPAPKLARLVGLGYRQRISDLRRGTRKVPPMAVHRRTLPNGHTSYCAGTGDAIPKDCDCPDCAGRGAP